MTRRSRLRGIQPEEIKTGRKIDSTCQNMMHDKLLSKVLLVESNAKSYGIHCQGWHMGELANRNPDGMKYV